MRSVECYDMKHTNSVALPEPRYNLYCGTMFHHHLAGLVFVDGQQFLDLAESHAPDTWLTLLDEFRLLYFGYMFLAI